MSLFSKKQTQQHPSRQVVTDTSGLIDGRIVAIAKSGFVPQRIIVPRFVVAELQFLADNGDSRKRERARFGLDVIRELQDLRITQVLVARDDFPGIAEVDDKLIAIAKRYGAMLYTTDYNLNKVAQIEGITVLNVNELAQALRPPLLPGERIEVKLTQAGQDKTQGVGYLEDGTMIVVEKAASKIGQKVLVECTRMLQTQAGKMMFGVLAGTPQGLQSHSNRHSQIDSANSTASAQARRAVENLPSITSSQITRSVSSQKQGNSVERTNRSLNRVTRPAAKKGASQQQPATARRRGTTPTRSRLTPEDRLMRALGNQ